MEEMDSGDAENLRLLDRHDLGITFTKVKFKKKNKFKGNFKFAIREI